MPIGFLRHSALFIQNVMIEKLERKVHEGQPFTPEEVLQLTENAPLDALCEASHRITLRHASRKFDLCSIINAKSGRCSENCKWCAQSSHYKTQAEVYDSSPLKNVSDRHSIMKPRTSTVSPSSPADGNPLPNRLPNFATQSAICGDIRLSNFAPHWDYLMKKNCVPCTKRELPVIIAIWKLLLLIFPNFVPPTHKSRNLPHLPPPAV